MFLRRDLVVLVIQLGILNALEIVETSPFKPDYSVIEQTGFFCEGRDSCNAFKPNEDDVRGFFSADNDWKRQNCFCDDLCAMYGDCCIDAPSYNRQEQAKNHLNFGCVELKQYDDIYMRQKCPDDWTNPEIRDKCQDVSQKDPFGAMPVTSNKTGVTYRNYFCAVCNRDSSTFQFWKPRLECVSLAGYANRFKNTSADVLAKHLRFNEAAGSWGLYIERGGINVFHECTIDPVVPEGIKIRPCTGKNMITSCPEGYAGNATTKELCESYTALVFEPTTSYRNVHCAICNNATLSRIICLNLGPFGRNYFKPHFNNRAFSLLFDIGGNLDDKVGFVGTSCEEGQLYDPFFRKCRNVVCGSEDLLFKDGKCIDPAAPTAPSTTTISTTESSTVSTKTTTTQTTTKDALDSTTLSTTTVAYEETTTATDTKEEKFRDCPKFELQPGEFNVLNETTVFVEQYGALLLEGDYVLQEDGVLVICALPHGALDGLAKFDANMGQVTLICLGVSIICLTAHILVAAVVPELQNLSGKNLTSLSVALLGGYVSFIALMFVDKTSIGEANCVVLAVIMYFFFMSSFFWMMVIAFDVCRTLRLASTQLRLATGKQWKKFGLYSLIGWVAPLTLTTAVVVIEHLKDSVPEDYRPGFGDSGLCWFSNKKALLVYFAVPFAKVMMANIFLFVYSACVVYGAAKNTAKLTTCTPKTNFYLYLRLAVIMGLTWIIGLVAGFVDVQGVWYAFVAFNTLQGMMIFISFTCTKKVYKTLQDKWEGVRTSTSGTWRFTKESAVSTRRSQLEIAGLNPAGPQAVETEAIPSRYGSRSKTMYTVSKQQASSLTQNSFDGRFL